MSSDALSAVISISAMVISALAMLESNRTVQRNRLMLDRLKPSLYASQIVSVVGRRRWFGLFDAHPRADGYDITKDRIRNRRTIADGVIVCFAKSMRVVVVKHKDGTEAVYWSTEVKTRGRSPYTLI